MSRLDDLPPDQRATLSLLLGQRKSYGEVAALLGIPARAVHDRAHAALAVLAPGKARELTAEHRESVAEYLLGQQSSVGERLATRTYLDGSPAGRAWAEAIAAAIAPMSSAPLPEIPAGADAQPGPVPAQSQPAAPAPAGSSGEDHTTAPPRSAAASSVRPGGAQQTGSRLGGALLLGGIVIAVIVAVILLTGGGGGGGGGGGSSHATTSATGTASAGASGAGHPAKGSTGTSGPSEVARLTLSPTEAGSKAVGVVAILQEGGKQAFYLAAEHLPPSHGFFYAVWLYNSPTSFQALSRSPPVGANGQLQGGALLPANAAQYGHMLLTRETSDRPSHPGAVVLSGPFKLSG